MDDPREIAIVGGGLAGLTLGVALVRHGVRARITILDPRTEYADDRTWCFWDVLDHPFRHAVSHRWHAWRITTSNTATRATSQQYAYCRLPAGAFYEQALATLEAADNVTLALGHTVTSVTGGSHKAVVRTEAGPLAADLAFDARPPAADQWSAGHHPFFSQGFEGWRVRAEKPVWDPAVVDLMDFSDRPGAAAIGFLYTLPLSANEALVESTVFAPAGSGRADHGDHIQRALAARLGDADYSVLARESGCIPMTTAPPPAREGERIVPIGTRAGAPRPSSGYAFLPIQRHSQRLAAQIAAGRYPDARLRSRTTRWLDGVFLRRLWRDPAGAPALFHRLFERVSPDRLVRFLTETGSPRDHLAVMAALPMAAFAGEATIGRWRPLRPVEKP